MDGQTYENSPLCPTGHWPFEAAAQKARGTNNIGKSYVNSSSVLTLSDMSSYVHFDQFLASLASIYNLNSYKAYLC